MFLFQVIEWDTENQDLQENVSYKCSWIIRTFTKQKIVLQIFLIYKKMSKKICKEILQIYLIYEKKYKNLLINL